MPRTTRLIVDGGTYHVLTRGNNGQQVFHEDADYQRYLQLVSTYARGYQLKLYHFALMPNHVHLVAGVIRGETLSQAMHRINLTYAWFYRRRYRYKGHLWQGRFKSLLIDRDSYLLECGRYVELNPVRAGLVRHPADYAWSSYRVYAYGFDNPLIAPNPLYDTLGASAGQRQERYQQFIQEGIRQGVQPPLDRYQFLGGTSAATKAFEELFGLPSIRRRRGRPRKVAVAARMAPENGPGPNFSNRGSDDK